MKIKIIRAVTLALLITTVYTWGVATGQYKYFPHSNVKAIHNKFFKSEPIINAKADAYWANEIKNGGYTLYFRHSQRSFEMGGLITAYDFVQLLKNDDNLGMTCLTSQGKQDANLVGVIFKMSGVKIGNVISSPLCRSKEMAMISFGKIDAIENSFVHRPVFNSSEFALQSEKIKEALIKYSPQKDENTIITAHTNTLEFYAKDIFKSYDERVVNNLDQSGFYVIQNVDGNLLLKYKFQGFESYVSGLSLLSGFIK